MIFQVIETLPTKGMPYVWLIYFDKMFSLFSSYSLRHLAVLEKMYLLQSPTFENDGLNVGIPFLLS